MRCFYCAPESNSDAEQERDETVRIRSPFHCWAELVAVGGEEARAKVFGACSDQGDLDAEDDAMVIEMLAGAIAMTTNGGK